MSCQLFFAIEFIAAGWLGFKRWEVERVSENADVADSVIPTGRLSGRIALSAHG